MHANPRSWMVMTGWMLLAGSARAAELPAAFDWRNHGGNYLSRVRDQGQCESCWAFAVLGAMEAMLKIAAQRPDWDPNLSEQQLVSCGTCGSCAENCEELTPVLEGILQRGGVALEKDLPYAVSDQIPCASAPSDWKDRAFQLSAYKRVPTDTPGIKQQLLSGPVIFKFTVYMDFFYHGSGVYRHEWGAAQGTHYAVLVGWNDAEGAWIIRNSWGPDFNEAGYYRLAYENSDIQKDPGYALSVALPEGFTLPDTPPTPDPTTPVTSGCGCAAEPAAASPLALGALGLLALLRRRFQI